MLTAGVIAEHGKVVKKAGGDIQETVALHFDDKSWVGAVCGASKLGVPRCALAKQARAWGGAASNSIPELAIKDVIVDSGICSEREVGCIWMVQGGLQLQVAAIF